MRRKKEPNLGLWVAPGGKVEKDEAPLECAVRELKEETGLTAQTVHLRGMVSVVMPELETPMLHFLYLVTNHSGNLTENAVEGDFHWHRTETISDLTMPTTNRLFLPHVLNQSEAFYQARYSFDARWQLVDVSEFGLRAILKG